jgi:hypothetical protein
VRGVILTAGYRACHITDESLEDVRAAMGMLECRFANGEHLIPDFVVSGVLLAREWMGEK